MKHDELQDLLATQEALDPELQKYLEVTNNYEVLRHPLVYSVPYTPHWNALHNRLLKHKKETLAEALEHERWSTFINLHERPWRLDAFKKIEKLMPDHLYWKTLSDIWTDSENIFENAALWKHYLTSNRPCRESFMNAEEQKTLEALPSVFKIYRGYKLGHNSHHPKKGMSYTLDKAIALWFAKRYGTDDGKVTTKTVNKKEVFALLLRRSEQEIILI